MYVQSTISPEAAEALFLHLEQTVSRFTDDIVASEDTVLEANINLLQGMRLAVFMAATGFIRDGTTKEVNTIRMSALSDRLVEIVAAVAFARYFKVILGRVAKLYIESSQLEAKASMWKELDSFWEVGCHSLARALVHRRSDVRFSLSYHVTRALILH